jgi:sugar phosphate permease
MVTLIWPKRFTLVGMCALAGFICYIDRVAISVTILPMAEEFGWDRSVQGLVLSSFFMGYLLTQIAGGVLADRFGGKIVLAVGLVAWSVATMLTPLAAVAGLGFLLLVRIGMGAGEGVAFPAIWSLYSSWVPVTERSRTIGLTISASPLGTVVALLLVPWIVQALGWEWAFYLFGGVGILWYVVWQRVASDNPAQHPGISAEELAVIASGTEPQSESTKRPTVREFLSSKPVWAIIVCHFCFNWGNYVLLAWLPTFVSDGLGVDFALVGVFAMVPHFAFFFFANVAGWCTDTLIARGMRLILVRKLMTVVGFSGGAIALASVGYMTSAFAAIAAVAIGLAASSFAIGGFCSNHMDVAPKHAGALMGLSNTAGTLPGIIGVYVSGLILEATQSWQLVFQVAAAIYVFGMIVYLVFASVEKQFD